MRIKINTIKLVSSDGMTDLERIDMQLKALILSAEGTIPGSRGFGLPNDYVSRPIHEALNILAMELDEKCEEFIPDITIANIEGDHKFDGSCDVTIYVERRE